MNVNGIKILTSGRLAEEFKANLADIAGSNNTIIDHIEAYDQNKLNEYNAIASFSIPEYLNISHIEWIHSFGAGVDAFINRKDLNKNLVLTRTVGSMGEKIAEYCLAHVLACKQNLYEAYESQKKREWNQRTPGRLKNLKIGILGTGNMGKATAGLFTILGAEVIGINRDGRNVDGFSKCFSFDQFAGTVSHDQVLAGGIDTIICTLPATPDTIDLLTPIFFSKFSGIHFINVGRGSVVTEDTILTAIVNGNISRATLDVFADEPLPSSSKLWDNEKVFITPHQASLTDISDVKESFESAFEAIKKGNGSSLFVNIAKGY